MNKNNYEAFEKLEKFYLAKKDEMQKAIESVRFLKELNDENIIIEFTNSNKPQKRNALETQIKLPNFSKAFKKNNDYPVISKPIGITEATRNFFYLNQNSPKKSNELTEFLRDLKSNFKLTSKVSFQRLNVAASMSIKQLRKQGILKKVNGPKGEYSRYILAK